MPTTVTFGFVGRECFDDDGADLYGDAPRPVRRQPYGSYALLDGTPAFADGETLLDAEGEMLMLAEERRDEDEEMRLREEMLRGVGEIEVPSFDSEIEMEIYFKELDALCRALLSERDVSLEHFTNGASHVSVRRAVYEEFGGFDLDYSKPPAHQPFKERTTGRARRNARRNMQDAA